MRTLKKQISASVSFGRLKLWDRQIHRSEIPDIINNRRSIRKYSEKPLCNDLILKLTKAAMQAPSAGNQQQDMSAAAAKFLLEAVRLSVSPVKELKVL
ncbi:MAG: nitroreductase family protein [Spirochaetales bacterium]|uniref:Nitroreductase family protein n=1 Tax=Candidatus Thalassospirochaeta sargassi TaxID=3119039 RepID=A0AAJ1I9J3_9SPIO|nr:nitroreductase family protein [Spirochaetales bacterium]